MTSDCLSAGQILKYVYDGCDDEVCLFVSQNPHRPEARDTVPLQILTFCTRRWL
jgi:hypothetical protein